MPQCLAGVDRRQRHQVIGGSRAPKNEIAGAARVLKAVEEGHLQGVTTAILFGEIRYVYLREDKLGFEIARAAIEAEANLRVVAVTASLAIHAAELRRKYYSKKNMFSYNDGLYLATGLAEKADLIVTHRSTHWPYGIFWTGVALAVAAGLVYAVTAWRSVRR